MSFPYPSDMDPLGDDVDNLDVSLKSIDHQPVFKLEPELEPEGDEDTDAFGFDLENVEEKPPPPRAGAEIKVPPEFLVRVVLEDIALNPKWASKLKPKRSCVKRTMLFMQKAIRKLKLTTREKPTIPQKCHRSKSKSKVSVERRSKTKTRRKKMTKEERIRDNRLRKFKKARRRHRFSLTVICRRRRNWEYQRMKRSEKVELTLEKIITGHCRLRTLKNRKTWSKRGRKHHTGLDCPYCAMTFKTDRSKVYHVRLAHPKRYPDFKRERAGEHQIRSKNGKSSDNEAQRKKRKKLNESEHPKWVHKKRIRFYDFEEKRIHVCDECGETFAALRILRNHMAKVHNPNRSKGRCPICQETYITGSFLWHHFLSKHLNYDILTLSKARGERLGFKYEDPAVVAEKTNRVKGQVRTTMNVRRIAPDGSEEYVCDVCGQNFESANTAMRHKKQMHSTDRQIWCCEICAKNFKSRDARDAHVRQIHEGEDFRCDICNRKLQTRGKLWRHKVEYHEMRDLPPPEGIVILTCVYCGEGVMRGMGLHVKKNHPEKVCEYLETTKMEKKMGMNKKPKHKLTEERRMKEIMRKREQRRKWKEEGVMTAPWIAKRPPNKCPHCGVAVKLMKQASWADHLEREHGIVIERDKKKWPCPMEGCNRLFFKATDVKRHTIHHFQFYRKLIEEQYVSQEKSYIEGLMEYKCMECHRAGEKATTYSTDGEVMIHFLIHHTDIYHQLKGDFEPEVGDFAETLKRQCNNPNEKVIISDPVTMTMTTTKIYTCPHCPTELFSDYDLRCHVEVTHQHECWRCPFPDCTKVVLSPQEMDEHFLNEHSINVELPTQSTSEDKRECKAELILTKNNSGQQNDSISKKSKAGRKRTKLQ